MRALLEAYETINGYSSDLADIAEAHTERNGLDLNIIKLLLAHARKRAEHMQQDLSLIRALVRA